MIPAPFFATDVFPSAPDKNWWLRKKYPTCFGDNKNRPRTFKTMHATNVEPGTSTVQMNAETLTGRQMTQAEFQDMPGKPPSVVEAVTAALDNLNSRKVLLI